MEDFITTVVDILIVAGIIAYALGRNKKKSGASGSQAPKAANQYQSYGNKPGKYDTYKKAGKYDTYNKPGKHVTFNKKSIFNTAGAQPHVHETGKYRSMSDASKLPPGYILLNGEPVRVADLDGK